MSEADLPFPNAVSQDVREFLVAVHAHLSATEPRIAPATLSSALFGSGKQIERLINGADVTTARLRAAWQRLRDLEQGGPRTRARAKSPAGAAPANQESDDARQA